MTAVEQFLAEARKWDTLDCDYRLEDGTQDSLMEKMAEMIRRYERGENFDPRDILFKEPGPHLKYLTRTEVLTVMRCLFVEFLKFAQQEEP